MSNGINQQTPSGGCSRLSVAVVVYPGTNCEHDVVHALREAGAEPELVWHREEDLSGFDGAVLPGGFAHGDYLRPGAIARFSPVMKAIEELADAGRPVLGICNGFQVLCEVGLLPGALVENRDLRFICKFIHVRVDSTDTVLTRAAEPGQVIRIPLNSYRGSYAFDATAAVTGRVAMRYCDEAGELGAEHNVNGSAESVACLSNERGNVVGLMPHPERASDGALGSGDGKVLIESFVAALGDA